MNISSYSVQAKKDLKVKHGAGKTAKVPAGIPLELSIDKSAMKWYLKCRLDRGPFESGYRLSATRVTRDNSENDVFKIEADGLSKPLLLSNKDRESSAAMYDMAVSTKCQLKRCSKADFRSLSESAGQPPPRVPLK
jgi:hypothetical protein